MRPYFMFNDDLLLHGTTKAVKPLRDLDPAAKTTLPAVFLMSDGKRCDASEDTIADICGVCRSTAHAGLANLKDSGWIKRVEKERWQQSTHYHNSKVLHCPTALGNKPHGYIEAAILEDGMWSEMCSSDHAVYLVLRCLVRVDECNEAARLLQQGLHPLTKKPAGVSRAWRDEAGRFDWRLVMAYDWSSKNKRQCFDVFPYVHTDDLPKPPLPLKQLSFYSGISVPTASKALDHMEELGLVIQFTKRRRDSRRIERRVVIPPIYPGRINDDPPIDYVI